MISKKTISAIEVCLAIADMQDAGPVTGAALSERLKLSISHLENILKQLKQRRLIASSRGPGGGYTMAQDLSRTNLWDIASVFEKTHREMEKMGEPATVAARYELGLENVVVEYLRGIVLVDVLNRVFDPANVNRVQSTFKLSPIQAPARPKVPNSVFQLHMAL
jgi:Rrf2 family iron-sulfur cluster assembly transcriptional regulator